MKAFHYFFFLVWHIILIYECLVTHLVFIDSSFPRVLNKHFLSELLDIERLHPITALLGRCKLSHCRLTHLTLTIQEIVWGQSYGWECLCGRITRPESYKTPQLIFMYEENFRWLLVSSWNDTESSSLTDSIAISEHARSPQVVRKNILQLNVWLWFTMFTHRLSPQRDFGHPAKTVPKYARLIHQRPFRNYSSQQHEITVWQIQCPSSARILVSIRLLINVQN